MTKRDPMDEPLLKQAPSFWGCWLAIGFIFFLLTCWIRSLVWPK